MPKPKTGGRKAGTPNKISKPAKDNVIAVFEGIGGVKSMIDWANGNQTDFYRIYSKMLPTAVTGEDGGPVELKITREFIHSRNPEPDT